MGPNTMNDQTTEPEEEEELPVIWIDDHKYSGLLEE